MSSTSMRKGRCPTCRVTWHWKGSITCARAACRKCMTPLDRAPIRYPGEQQNGEPVARLRPVLRLTEINTKANI